MGNLVNIKIKTDSGEYLDYTTPQSLNIRFNRIADDYTDPKKRWGEFSYNFTLPKTKRNERILQFPSSGYNQRKFKVNPIGISVFNNDSLLLTGNLELQKIREDSYENRFYSQLTQLIDSLQDLNLKDLTGMPQIENWNYENTITAHTNSNYLSSDEADYQFPLIFYSTWFTPYSTYSGLTDSFGYSFREQGDRAMQNYYYLLNRTQTGHDGERYFHELPLCFYLKTIMEKLLEEIGWSLSGSFFEDENIKRIILLYSGENDIYDQACYWKDSSGNKIPCSGATTPAGYTRYLDTNKFLPNYGAVNFISDVISMFNLFMSVDINNKILSFETYDKVFMSKTAPYDITDKVLSETIDITKIENYDVSVGFADPGNKRITGDNYYIGENSTNTLTCNYKKTSDNYFDIIYNHIGETDGEIKTGFAAPAIKRVYIRNTDNYAGTITNANDSVIFLPNMSKQTPQDNNGKKFNSSTGDTASFNSEEWINFKGCKPTLMYYYGISPSGFEQQSSKGDSADYYYFDFNNGKQKIGIASPFAYKSYRTNIENALDDDTEEKAIYASYLQTIYTNLGDSFSFETDFSLIFGDSYDLADTLYTKFYQNRMNRYKNSEVLNATMRFNDMDWNIMQFNQPILYNGEIYSLMSIKNYDVVTGVAQIQLIKQL